MAIERKYLSFEKLGAYDALIKAEIEDKIEEAVKLKSDTNHNHNDLYYQKSEIDSFELITVEDIDAICGGSIQYAEDVMF